MKKRIISILLAIAISMSFAVSSFAITAEEKLQYILELDRFMKDYSISVGKDSEPMSDALKKLLENEDFYNQFMQSMISQYDRYSLFVPAGNYEKMYPTTSSYVGVGITLEQYGSSVRITKVTEGSPAQEAGFQKGDIIMYVNKIDYSNSTPTQISNAVRGKEGEKVIITVKRNVDGKDNYFTQTLVRRYIGIPNFTSKVVEDGIYYMDFTKFADNNTYLQFVFALQDMVKSNSRALILDLRGNPGGEVNMAFNILNRLIPDKKTYFSTRSKINGENQYEFYESEGIGAALNKIIILQDGGSASASEIIISSLKDLGYAETVGEKSYGKGRGQYHVQLADGSVAVITGIELMSPSLVDYDGIGIAPNYEVKNTMEKDESGVLVAVDKQYEKALELAREYAKQPQKYTVDALGNFKNNTVTENKDK